MQIKKVKVFVEQSADSLEQVVNEWLAANPNIEILEAQQSVSGKFQTAEWAITLSIIYSTTQAA
jgi:hypothetical protein